MIVNKLKQNRGNIYYNAIIQPDPRNGPQSILCKYSENLAQAIIDNPNDYYCSIIRFILPIDAIPTVIFPVDLYQDPATFNYLQSNLVLGINLGGSFPVPPTPTPPPTPTTYTGAVPVGGTNFYANVIYDPPSNTPPPTTGVVSYDQSLSAFYWIYSIQQMINMFNKALNTAMIAAAMPLLYLVTLTVPSNATIGDIYRDSHGSKYTVNVTIVGGVLLTLNDTFNSGPPIPATNGVLTKVSGLGDSTIGYTNYTATGIARPYYTYDPVTQLISLHVDDEFIATGAKIFMNKYMVNYLASFNLYFDASTVSATPQDRSQLHFHNLSVLPKGQTSPYIITQNFTTISLWFALRRIIVTSSTLPITPEVLPAGGGRTGTSESGIVNYMPVVTDFAVALDDANQLQEVLIYNPTAQYRLVDMTSNSPLNKIDLSFYWEDRFNNILPVSLSAYQQASVKLGFFKKSLYEKDNREW